MSEKYTSDRIKFPNAGDQTKFLLTICQQQGLDWQKLGKALNRNPKTIRDWANEKYRMPYTVAETLAKSGGLKLSKSVIREPWSKHARQAGIRGGNAVVQKNGGRVILDEKHRKAKWNQWWEATGQYRPHPIINNPSPYKKPEKSEQLAEFIGIVLGDGGISHRQITITLHREDDREYSHFIRQLITGLFELKAGTYINKHAQADNIVISRTRLVNELTDKFGLKVGNKVKQQVDVPSWIKVNPNYLVACTRGLIDTDGCVFTHRYKVKGRWYSYKKLGFTNRSKPLLNAVHTCLTGIGLKPHFSGNYDIRLESKRDIQQYMQIIGSHNPKHLNRYQE